MVKSVNELDEEALDKIIGGISFSEIWDGVSDVAGQVSDALTSDTAKAFYKALISIL